MVGTGENTVTNAAVLKDIKVGIVGLGLIGGSIALALNRKAKVSDIVAVDISKTAVSLAVKDGVIKAGSHDFKILKDCDIIFIATPVHNVVSCIKEAAKVCKNALFTDVASTKATIVNEVKNSGLPKGARFVPGHPMTGSERSKYQSASMHLFENAYYIVCDDFQNEKDIELVRSIAFSMGALPISMDSNRHDSMMAYISHLPHLAASALVGTAAKTDDKKRSLSRLAAGGFKDITRVASSDSALWRSIFQSGKDTVLTALEDYIGILSDIQNKIIRNDFDGIEEFLEMSRVYRNSLPQGKSGFSSDFELWVDVADRPGAIGQVATLLGKDNISILNINIQNSREYEGGVLRITLKNTADCQRAKEILTACGYDVSVKG